MCPATWSERLLNLLWAGSFIAVSAVALWVHPDSSGLGTHTQLGLPPCGLYQTCGIPCLSCGMTTSFSHMVRFQLIGALGANPLGAILYVCYFLGAVLSLYSAATGWSFFAFLGGRDWTRIGVFFILAAAGSWSWKIASVFLH